MGHDTHAADRPPYQKHYFQSMQQQSQATLFGIWLFLVQELMFFGGLFGAYAVYRYLYPEAWLMGAESQNLTLGLINTVVLIASSYTVVLMVSAARHNSKNGMALWMVLTMILGGVFLGVKYFEYKAKWDHRLVPGKYFDFTYYELPHLMGKHDGAHGGAGPAGAAGETHAPAAADSHAAPRRNDDMAARGTDPRVPAGIMIYYSLYFAMSGMHALHMVIGEGIAIWLLILILKGRFSDKFYPHIEYFGLYWHFVDIVWIFLFPLLYLI